ncbi:MAG: NADH-quinone oxidoreductase subunit NuoK [Puniceicoccales bacterium]|jgi:NADH-quinone oxidoreductase subunit K|nr:NADH-quinone oxidoreductase subunit NuoK [Puniceicoccales bacterium]
MNSLHLCLLFSSLLFCVGLGAAFSRNGAIFVLLGVELMLNAANINFIAFWRHLPATATATTGGAAAGAETVTAAGAGVIFALFSIAVAAAEAAVGLALIIAVYRHRRGTDLAESTELRG